MEIINDYIVCLFCLLFRGKYWLFSWKIMLLNLILLFIWICDLLLMIYVLSCWFIFFYFLVKIIFLKKIFNIFFGFSKWNSLGLVLLFGNGVDLVRKN